MLPLILSTPSMSKHSKNGATNTKSDVPRVPKSIMIDVSRCENFFSTVVYDA